MRNHRESVATGDGVRRLGDHVDIEGGRVDDFAGHGEHFVGSCEVEDLHLIEDDDSDVPLAFRHFSFLSQKPALMAATASRPMIMPDV